jgi:hypothetical protein
VGFVVHAITLQLPEEIYTQLKLASETLKQPIEEVLVQSVKMGLPPPIDDLPPEYQPEFAAMMRMSDGELWQIAQRVFPETKQRQLSNLLRKNQTGTLTEKEERKLDTLHREANQLMLRKAHAYALLKWRGHRVPKPTERNE